MVQNQIWFNFNARICHKAGADLLAVFKLIPQGFLEDEILSPIQASCSEN